MGSVVGLLSCAVGAEYQHTASLEYSPVPFKRHSIKVSLRNEQMPPPSSRFLSVASVASDFSPMLISTMLAICDDFTCNTAGSTIDVSKRPDECAAAGCTDALCCLAAGEPYVAPGATSVKLHERFRRGQSAVVISSADDRYKQR